MKILVIGGSGQVGKCFEELVPNSDINEYLFCSSSTININDFEHTKLKIKEYSPKIIINLAAYTNVDKAESDYDQANILNNYAVRNLAEISKSDQILLIHISTDYVYDGNIENGCYDEDSPCNPLSVYGITKFAGDMSIINSGCNYIILRTSWVYSEYGKNFVKTISDLGKKRDEISVINDQKGSPTCAKDIAVALQKIILKFKKNDLQHGLYNFTGNETMSWYDFAKIIFKESNGIGIKTPGIVKPISTEEYPLPANRPKNSFLSNKKFEANFGKIETNTNKNVKNILKKINDRI